MSEPKTNDCLRIDGTGEVYPVRNREGSQRVPVSNGMDEKQLKELGIEIKKNE